MVDLIVQFLDEPTFNQLRTIEQLGYVVFTRSNITRDIHGIQFCIQSPGKGCSHIRNSLDKHLAAMLEKSKAMTDEEFQTMVKSVLVELEAKDKNLSEENSRFWKSEIANHRYMFDRNQRKIEAIKEISKSQW